MNLSYKKITTTNRLLSPQVTKQYNEDQKTPEKPASKQKKIWTSTELHIQMNPSAEEIIYRKKKLETISAVEKYSRYFKCTKCQFSFKPLTDYVEKIAVHSFLNVLFCKECLEFYEDGEFSMDSDGEEKYCRWCGEGGLIYSCSECVSGFCTTCIKKHFSKKYNGQVKKNNSWRCFLCYSKPLWFLRFICSIAVEEINKLGKGIKSNESTKKIKVVDNKGTEKDSKDHEEVQVSPRKKSLKLGNEESIASCSNFLSETRRSVSPVLQDANSSFSRKGIKRKNVIYSSSDESEDVTSKKTVKKIKVRESVDNSSVKVKSGVSSDVIEKLEKILRLAEYQMGFGVSWSSKMLNKLCKPDLFNSSEELKNECQKIKWFFSILSTYLVESCSSVDLIEKSIDCVEAKAVKSPEKCHLGEYSTVVKFLDFVTNQVKVFLEKGIQLQDLLEGEIYYDKQVIGVKVKSHAPAATNSPSQTIIPKSKIKISDSQIICDEVKSGSSGDESSVSTFEREPEADSSDTDIFVDKLNLSTSKTNYLEEAEEQKTKIQEILSILENP